MTETVDLITDEAKSIADATNAVLTRLDPNQITALNRISNSFSYPMEKDDRKYELNIVVSIKMVRIK